MIIGQKSASDTVPLLPAAGSNPPASGVGTIGQTVLQPVTSLNSTPAASASNAETESRMLQQAISNLNAHLKNIGNNSVEFSINSSTGQVVVQVVDTQTQAIIMQTPSKQAIAIAQAQLEAQANQRGLLIKTEA